jgi:hypothetical protein
MSGDKGDVRDLHHQRAAADGGQGGAGNGIVTSSPSGIFCGSSCSAAFPQGTTR